MVISARLTIMSVICFFKLVFCLPTEGVASGMFQIGYIVPSVTK